MTRVSVLLPVRDGADHIEAALTSLAVQTMPRFEVLVLDDGSADETADIVGRFAENDTRFKLVRGGREGLVPTLQRGLAQVQGDFVARMDADDVSYPTRLQVQLEFLLEHTELAGCGAGVRITPEGEASERALAYQDWLNGMTRWALVDRDLFVECPLAHPTFFFRIEALRRVGGYEARGWPEDYDLLLRLRRSGERFVAVPEVLLDWVDRPGRLSRSHEAYSLDAFLQCRLHHLQVSHLQNGRAVVVWGSGPTGKAFARACQGSGVPVAAFADVDPRKIGQNIYGVPVWEPKHVAGLKEALHVGAVARTKGREACREEALRWGLEDGRNFLSVA